MATSPRRAFERAIRSGLLPALALAASGRVHAVAGGAGGGGFDGGGGGDDLAGFVIELIFWIIWSLPFPFNLLALLVIGGALWFGGKQTRAVSGLNKVPSLAQAGSTPYAIPADFMRRNPGFDPATLIAKASNAFPAIQQAWSQQDLAPVRRWLSDGVWQRFNTQFAMMRLLGQTDRVDDLQVRRIFLDAVEADGNFDIAHIGIHFSATDDFVSAKFPALDQRGTVEMLEYWSFIRKAGVAGHDIYHGNRCPACGADLPQDLGEVARCSRCHAVTTLGDYDWVLSEITQADDYANRNRKLDKSGRLTQRIRAALGEDANFSLQLIEDKASNAYLQILAAQATRRPELMRRFVGDDLFGRLAQGIAEKAPCVFNRLYLNDVTLIDYFRRDDTDNLVVACRRTAQRLDIRDDILRLVDRAPYASSEILILTRDVGAAAPRGELYAHACPACGAPVGDTLDPKCAYCGEALNSTRREWIVSRLLDPEQYRALGEQAKPELTTHVAPAQLDPLFAARDYAFNNVMAILGSDGAISVDELAFAQELSRKMGYDAKRLAGMFDLARQRKLALRLPDDRKTAAGVLKLMEKAAQADQRITPAEQALLDEMRQRIAAVAT